MVKVNRTPLKRFGEFNSQWQTEKLDYLVTWASGGTPSKSVDAYWNGEIPWISASSMRGLEYSDSEIKITAEGLVNGSKLARKGNLLLLVRGSMLFNKIPIGIVACDVSFNQDVKSLACKADIIPRFLLYWFYASEHKLLNMVVGTGIGAGKLDLQDLKLMDVVLPSLPEQQKIASFLTTVDDKIQQLSKKKVLLEQYKKGVMQQLFSQKLRFKDDQGNAYPDWEEKTLGELGNTFNGLTGKSKENFGSGHPYITYKQIFDNSMIDVSKFEYVEVGQNESQNLVKLGDVFFTTSSETANEIGYASVLLSQVETVYLNSFCFGYRIHSFESLSPYYAKHLFRSPQFRVDIQKLAQGSTRYNMSKIGLMKLSVLLPSIAEQTKIANFLSAINDKINGVNQQIEHTRQFKKGLLQQMFV